MRNRVIPLALLLPPCLCLAQVPPEPPLSLSVQQSMEMAVNNNLAVRLAKAGSASSRGKTLQAASSLLPRLLGTMSQTRVFLENLAAQGFNLIPLPISLLLGPFNSFDARIQLVQEVFDRGATLRRSAASAAERSAALEEALAREQVAAAASLGYVELLRARKAIEAAQADVGLASELLQLAQDKQAAGTAAGIDVARAKTRGAEEKLRLLEARTVAQESDLRFKRVVVMPLGRTVALKDDLAFIPMRPPSLEDAVAAALRDRLELKISEELFQSASSAWGAAQAERLPSVALEGDIGLSGNRPDSNARTTGSAGVALKMPFFSGRAIEGRVAQAAGARSAAQAQLDDMRQRVEEDARLALTEVAAAIERVSTADEALRLAENELEMARDRFAAGVADNVELLNSQTALGHARDAQVGALARYHAARINLSMALGRMMDFRF